MPANRPRAERAAERAIRSAAGTASSTRLRKLVCSSECGYPPARVSRAAIKAGLPVCPCGALMWPEALEDAALAHEHGHLTSAQLEDHPERVELAREEWSVAHGQASTAQRKGYDSVSPAGLVAWARVLESRQARAQEHRLNALRDHNPYAPAAATAAEPDPMPF